MTFRVTAQTMKVLVAIVERPDVSGADLCRATGLATGTLYPILLRLEKAGAVASKWEAGDPAQLGRPRRRYYRITAEGIQRARETAQEWQGTFGSLAWT